MTPSIVLDGVVCMAGGRAVLEIPQLQVAQGERVAVVGHNGAGKSTLLRLLTGFMVPALTVQPLIENAVKYGVGQAEDGGTVTLATRELDDRFEITVSDDGVGFDPYEKQADGRTHIGIDNVVSRLWEMSRATLVITSEKGVGTTAVITVPKGATE